MDFFHCFNVRAAIPLTEGMCRSLCSRLLGSSSCLSKTRFDRKTYIGLILTGGGDLVGLARNLNIVRRVKIVLRIEMDECGDMWIKYTYRYGRIL